MIIVSGIKIGKNFFLSKKISKNLYFDVTLEQKSFFSFIWITKFKINLFIKYVF